MAQDYEVREGLRMTCAGELRDSRAEKRGGEREGGGGGGGEGGPGWERETLVYGQGECKPDCAKPRGELVDTRPVVVKRGVTDVEASSCVRFR